MTGASSCAFGRRFKWTLALVGAFSLVACALGALLQPGGFFRAYLVAYLFWLGLAHGCLVVLLVYHLTGGAWGYAIRRILEAAASTMWLLAVLFMPLGFGLRELYDWAQPELVEASHELQHKAIYLTAAAFWTRAVISFAVWIALATVQRHCSRREDETGNPQWTDRLKTLAGPGLIAFGLTITFTSVDWIMSLQPAFRSTIFGPLVASGEVLCGFSAAVVVVAFLFEWSPQFKNAVSVETVGDLGSLLFTFLCVWAYLSFFQFMLIWMSNLRYDVIWFLPRLRDGWQYVAWTLIVVHFVVPFFLLLSRDIKRDPRVLGAMAGLIVVMHFVQWVYQILPAFPNASWSELWLLVAALVGIGGLWLANFAWNLEQLPLLAIHDANRHSEDESRPVSPMTAVAEVPHG
jgi:hypothetical protein